jgi:3-hydroxyisobutyryl-CoA hydrolase
VCREDGISVFSHFSVAAENAEFAMPETRIGHFADLDASYFLSRSNDNIGKYIGMCAHIVKAKNVL